jgi:hypothetical protein
MFNGSQFLSIWCQRQTISWDVSVVQQIAGNVTSCTWRPAGSINSKRVHGISQNDTCEMQQRTFELDGPADRRSVLFLSAAFSLASSGRRKHRPGRNSNSVISLRVHRVETQHLEDDRCNAMVSYNISMQPRHQPDTDCFVGQRHCNERRDARWQTDGRTGRQKKTETGNDEDNEMWLLGWESAPPVKTDERQADGRIMLTCGCRCRKTRSIGAIDDSRVRSRDKTCQMKSASCYIRTHPAVRLVTFSSSTGSAVNGSPDGRDRRPNIRHKLSANLMLSVQLCSRYASIHLSAFDNGSSIIWQTSCSRWSHRFR